MKQIGRSAGLNPFYVVGIKFAGSTMRNHITLLLCLFLVPGFAWTQCTTNDATACQCADQNQTDCDLLPDIGISDYALANYLGGPTEYGQTGNGANNGRLRVSGSTPNYGVGPFTVGAEDLWTCGNDTFTDYNQALAVCSTPSQLIKQKIYHKNNGVMSYWERWAGSMTYHPTHGHMHVDDWATFTLRVEDPNDPNPLNWAIVGDGAKVGFCLMDYGTCSNYNGHCRDAGGNILMNNDFTNWGLGGGQYNCSPVEQGISVGHTDIYSENLDGMWIDIPPGTCNGDYYIVIEVDPNNNFLESDETNNWTAIPFTLTQQVAAGSGIANVIANGPTEICAGDNVTLTADAGSAFQWSNGDTTQSITVSTGGSYTVTVTGPCGTGVSAPVVVTSTNTTQAPTTTGATVCDGGSATLSANGAGTYYWFDAPTAGNMVGSGPTFSTPSLTSTTDYYVEREEVMLGQQATGGPADNQIGTGANHTNNSRYLEFDALKPFTLASVWVDAQSDGNREIEVREANGTVVTSATVFIPQGQSRVTLNFQIPQQNDLRIGLSSNSMVDLYRNNAGVNYPYAISDLVSINSSSAGAQYYYFYYDWEVKTDDLICTTPRAVATATVTPLPAVSFAGLGASYTEVDPPVALVGSPAGGTFSGPGISGNNFDPSLAGSGGPYTVTYSYTDGNGCTNTIDQTVTVSPFVAILDGEVPGQLNVFPNPHNGSFNLSFELLNGHDVQVILRDVTGKVVQTEKLGKVVGQFNREFNMSDLSRGVYLLEVQVDENRFNTKVVYH